MSPTKTQKRRPERRRSDLARALRFVLDAADYDTDEDAARDAGMDPTTLSKWLNDQQRPSWPKLIAALPKWKSSLAHFESAICFVRTGKPGPYQQALDGKSAAEERVRELRQEMRRREQAERSREAAPGGRTPPRR